MVQKILEATRQFFAKDERGSITAESVLWIPVYMIFFALIADVSLVFHGKAKVMRAAQDANRHASTGYLVSEDQLRDMIVLGIDHFAPNANIVTNISDTSVITTIEVPVSDLEAVGLFGRFTDITVTVSTVHLLEV